MKSCRNGHAKTSENTYIRKNGYTECRPCSREAARRYKKGIPGIISERSKEYYDRNREEILKRGNAYNKSPEGKNRYYLRKYDITYEEYLTKCEEQEHSCAICSETKPLVVDHSHETGKARGLLCFNCNTGLGYFSDSSETLKQAREYLKKGWL